MSWINPSHKQVARHIDKMFQTEKGTAYYTWDEADPAMQKKFEAVHDVMDTHLRRQWLKYENLTSRAAHLDKVRGYACKVAKHLSYPAASSMVSHATDLSLRQLDHRKANNIPLAASTVPGTGRTFEAAIASANPDLGAATHEDASTTSAAEQ